MRKSKITTDPITTGASHRIVGPSASRIALWLFPPIAGSVTLVSDSPAVVGSGAVLSAGQSPIRLSISEDGDVVQREWFGIYSIAGNPMSYIEVHE